MRKFIVGWNVGVRITGGRRERTSFKNIFLWVVLCGLTSFLVFLFVHGIVNASRWSGRCHQKLEFADIHLEHPPLERPFSYYEKISLKNELHQRLRLISKGSIFHRNFLMVQVRTFWIENNN